MSDLALQKTGPAAPAEAAIAAALGRRSIVLVGMMGAGKSSVGRRLAARLGIPFVDADAKIEEAAQMTIADIFETYGEADFRSAEARVIARLLEGGPQVLATGGGAFMNAETRAAVRAKGIAFWLKADFEVLLRRVKRRSDRPLLQTGDPAETLKPRRCARASRPSSGLRSANAATTSRSGAGSSGGWGPASPRCGRVRRRRS